MDRAMLERELAFLQGNLHHYLTHWPAGQEGWRPTPDAYALIDRGAHLYGLPAAVAAVLRGAPDEETVQITGGPYTARGQLHLYPKQLGRPVSTDTIFTA